MMTSKKMLGLFFVGGVMLGLGGVAVADSPLQSGQLHLDTNQMTNTKSGKTPAEDIGNLFQSGTLKEIQGHTRTQEAHYKEANRQLFGQDYQTGAKTLSEERGMLFKHSTPSAVSTLEQSASHSAIHPATFPLSALLTGLAIGGGLIVSALVGFDVKIKKKRGT